MDVIALGLTLAGVTTTATVATTLASHAPLRGTPPVYIPHSRGPPPITNPQPSSGHQMASHLFPGKDIHGRPMRSGN